MKSAYGSTSKEEQLEGNSLLRNDTNVQNSRESSTSQEQDVLSQQSSIYFESLQEFNKKNCDSDSNDKRSTPLRAFAIKASLYVNVAILITKIYAYARTFSLSVLAALIDSALDVVSQKVLESTENHSNKVKRSSALYPAGAARLEPVGVLTCAALMGMASFEVLKESLEELFVTRGSIVQIHQNQNMLSFWGMLFIVLIKFALLALCESAQKEQDKMKFVHDSTLEALSQDHRNDAFSNAIAAVALLATMTSVNLWWVDPVGAIFISLYIIHSWYTTGQEQIEQLTGKAAPEEFIQELYNVAKNFDERMEVDVCRAYHFGPKFLVELEVVLPKDTLLFESHDLGMELQYEIEGREEVERCFVHIDYETRPYDEHVVSKVPELRERLVGKLKQLNSSHSV